MVFVAGFIYKCQVSGTAQRRRALRIYPNNPVKQSGALLEDANFVDAAAVIKSNHLTEIP